MTGRADPASPEDANNSKQRLVSTDSNSRRGQFPKVGRPRNPQSNLELPVKRKPKSNLEPPMKRKRGRPRKQSSTYITPDIEASQKTKRPAAEKRNIDTPLQVFKRLRLHLKTTNRPPLNIEAMNKHAEDMLSLEYAYQSTYAATPTTPTEHQESDWQIDNPLDILADVMELSSRMTS